MTDSNISLPCFFHYYRLPTSGTITIKPLSLDFNGIHVNNDPVDHTILYDSIISIEKGKLHHFTLETYMMRYYTCITTKTEKLYFSGFTMTEGMSQDKFISYVTEKIKKPTSDVIHNLIKAKESGIETMKILKQDQELIRSSEVNMKEMEYNLTLSERLSTGFQSLTGTVKNYFSKEPDVKTLTPVATTSKTNTTSVKPIETISSEDKEIQMISDLLDQVKTVSLEINDSLDQSNTSLTKLNSQVDLANQSMKKTNQKLDKLNKNN
jgi:hypothetical protein